MITGIVTFLRSAEPILYEVPGERAPFWVRWVLLQDFCKVKIWTKICWFSSWVGSKASQVQMLCYAECVLGTVTERLWSNFKQLNCIDADWSCLNSSLLFDFCHLGFNHVGHSFIDCLHSLVIIYFAAKPFQSARSTVLCFYFNLNLPERLRNKFFNFFSLIDAKAQRWCLARSVSYRCFLAVAATTTFYAFRKLFCLKSTKANTNFEVQNLSRIYWDRFIKIRFVF